MDSPPRFIVLCHRTFNASVVAACLLGVVFIWMPFENEVATKAFQSVLVLLGGSMLVLAAHRTVYWRFERKD